MSEAQLKDLAIQVLAEETRKDGLKKTPNFTQFMWYNGSTSIEDWIRTFEDQTVLQHCDSEAMRMKLLPGLMKEKAVTVVPKLHD